MKRLISLTVVLALVFSVLAAGSVFSASMGDADGDGELSDWDAIMFERYLAGWSVEVDTDVLDLDGDGEVSDWDAILLSRYLAGWEVELNPGGGEENLFTVAENGVSDYKFVVGDTVEYVYDNVLFISERLAKGGVDIGVAGDNETPDHCVFVETAEDYYNYDEDTYAPEGGILSSQGYRILADNDKNIHIIGTSLESTYAALEYFEGLFEGKDLRLEENFEYNWHPFKKLDGLTVGGVPVDEFRIVYEEGDSLEETAAVYIRKLLFTDRGAYLGEDGEGTHTISFVRGGENSRKGYVTVTEGNIVITGNGKTGFYRVFRDFLAEAGESVENGETFEIDYGDFITYEAYGAAGDGATDDRTAVYNAHNAQKTSGKPILAREDATYYIGKNAVTSVISADVDWSTAHFIIDDSTLANAGSNVFSIPAANNAASITSSISSLTAGRQNIGVALGGASLVTVENSSVKQYIRKGANQDSGSSQKEVILVDENGNVDPSTPILWDYAKVTYATARRIDDPVITVKGGIFTTIANQASSNYNYYNRGIAVNRSNAVIEGIAHYVTGEGFTGAPYNGFLMISEACNLTVRDTLLTPHYTYFTMGTGGSFTPMGTYDIQVTSTVGLKLENVIQSVTVTDLMHWGTFASNYSRNISLDGCILSRFDAHKGVCNVTLKNSTFGYQGINLIGHGLALIEGCRVYGSTMINLRDDYGSTWDGDLTIRNCIFYPNLGVAFADPTIISGVNTFDHDFGYTCYLPRNILIDGLYVNDSLSLSGYSTMLFDYFNLYWTSDSYTGQYPMVMTESVVVRGFESYSGRSIEPSLNTYMFGSIVIRFE